MERVRPRVKTRAGVRSGARTWARVSGKGRGRDKGRKILPYNAKHFIKSRVGLDAGYGWPHPPLMHVSLTPVTTKKYLW